MLSVWSVATLESSAMLSAELNAVFIDIRCCFSEMACVLIERSTFKTIAG